MPLSPRPPREEAPAEIYRIGPERGLGGRIALALDGERFSVTQSADAAALGRSIEADGPGPECVLLDDSNPSIEPLSIATRIGNRDQDLPIVLCTMDPSEYGPKAVLDAGIDELLTESDLNDRDSVSETLYDCAMAYRRRTRDRQDASLLRSMLEEFPVHIFAKDRSGRYVRSSSALHDSSRLLGNTDEEIWPERERGDRGNQAMGNVLDSDVRVENDAEFCTVEDRWFLVSKIPWHDDAETVGSAGLAMDITDRRQREEELQATTQLLTTIVQTSPAAIVVHDTEGTVQYWNPTAATMFGWSPEEAIREPYPPYVTEATREEFHSLVAETLSDGSIGPVEVRRRTKDGQWLDLQLSAATLDDGNGDPSRVVSVLTDVTDLKERERRLKRQNDRIEQFTRVIAHDLRNPVQVIRGQLDLGNARDAALAERALDRIEAIVDDVLSVARSEPLVTETEPVSVAAVARDVWQNVEGPSTTLSVAADCTIEANRARLYRLLNHLFENAVEHGSQTHTVVEHGSRTPNSLEHGSTNGGSQQDTSVDGHDAAESATADASADAEGGSSGSTSMADGDGLTVTVGCLPDGFFVADDGSGIAPEHRAQIFEPGYSTEPNATGFGLNVVREITEAHGWTIEFVETDTGARFEIHDVDRSGG